MIETRKFYLTKQGLERIKKEEEALRELKITKTNGGSPQVLHSEDMNPEYLAFQEDVGFLEARTLELENILKNAEIIKVPSKQKQDFVGLGATVLAELDGKKGEFKMVGTLEADPLDYKISNESPIGKAIFGKKAGETVFIKTADIERCCKIMKVSYGNI
ncbi:MAG: GreA/GreB family elongation factor [Candidatus Nealsonbacteria bacterium]|nr:GreA/GreB family elongation factor [Candidatus Nealsonbacteria bacterium]